MSASDRHGCSRRCLRLAGLLLAAASLQACNTPFNILAALDGPYISPERRAEMAYRAAQEQERLVAQASQTSRVAAPPAVTPTPVASAPARVVGPPTPAASELARPAPVAERPVLSLPPAATMTTAAPVTAPAPAPAPTPLPTASPAPSLASPTAVRTVTPAPAPIAAAPRPALVQAPTPTPAPAPAPAPAPIPTPTPAIIAPVSPISPSAGLMGPVVTREAPAPLATRLPSAFDLSPAPPDPVRRRPVPAAAPVPAPTANELPALAQTPASPAPAIATAAPVPVAAPTPTVSPAAPVRELQRAATAAGLTVVSAMPAPSAAPAEADAGGAGSMLRAFYDFAIARLDAPPAPGGRESVLLADPPSLDPALRRCGNLPPAVLVDVDPGNGLMPLVSTDTASPELARYLGLLRERGVTVYWISGHGPGAASQIRQRLVRSGLDPAGIDPLIVTRFAGESKQARRYALGESNCVIAIMGDQRGDFDELYDFVLDPIMAAPLEGHVNHGWFLAPPPLD